MESTETSVTALCSRIQSETKHKITFNPSNSSKNDQILGQISNTLDICKRVSGLFPVPCAKEVFNVLQNIINKVRDAQDNQKHCREFQDLVLSSAEIIEKQLDSPDKLQNI